LRDQPADSGVSAWERRRVDVGVRVAQVEQLRRGHQRAQFVGDRLRFPRGEGLPDLADLEGIGKDLEDRHASAGG
jgi:hypothetical protein